MSCIYMAVTNDEYELPITFGETQAELARFLGVTKKVVHDKIHYVPKTKRRGRVGFPGVCDTRYGNQ